MRSRRAVRWITCSALTSRRLLWKKIMPKLSAGRVQSPALRMIVEREEEVEAFKPREYWTLEGDVKSPGKHSFQCARLASNTRATRSNSSLSRTKPAPTRLATPLLHAAAGKLTVAKVDKKQRKRNPDSAVHNVHAATGSLAQAGL